MKRGIFATCLLCVIVICSTACSFSGTNPTEDLSDEIKPFENLSDKEISSVTVELLPPDIKVDLNGEQISELVAILKTVEIYEEDNSYRDNYGQAVIYSIIKNDGTQLTIMAYNPFIVINDIGYKTKYEPCEELNLLGNTITETPFGKQVK